jgi:hypothetical protein
MFCVASRSAHSQRTGTEEKRHVIQIKLDTIFETP